jgi:hypothetical protein
VPLGVCDHRTEAARAQSADVLDRPLAERARSRLQQQPEPVAPERHFPQLHVVDAPERDLRDLAALHHSYGNPTTPELVVECRDATLELVDPHGMVGMDVGGGADDLDAVGLSLTRHRDAVVHVDGTVVESGKDVAVEVDHWAKRKSRDSTLSGRGAAIPASGAP